MRTVVQSRSVSFQWKCLAGVIQIGLVKDGKNILDRAQPLEVFTDFLSLNGEHEGLHFWGPGPWDSCWSERSFRCLLKLGKMLVYIYIHI